jgi:hypothetical protein
VANPKPPIRTSDNDPRVNRHFELHREAIEIVQKSPIVSGTLIAGIELPDDQVVRIRHGLGGPYRAIFLSPPRIPAGATPTVVESNGYELLASEETSGDASSFTFSGLDGDTDVAYFIRMMIANESGADRRYRLKMNGVAYGSGAYNSIRLSTDGTTVSTLEYTDHLRLSIGMGDENTLFSTINVYAKSGSRRGYQGIAGKIGTSSAFDVVNGRWKNEVDNLTSITVESLDTSDVLATGIYAGSRFEIFRVGGQVNVPSGSIHEEPGNDTKREFWLKARGFGTTVTVNAWVVP